MIESNLHTTNQCLIMSTTIDGHANSDHPPLIEKTTILQLLEQHIQQQNQQATTVLHKGLLEDDFELLEEDSNDSAQDMVNYATSAAIVAELKTIYNKVKSL